MGLIEERIKESISTKEAVLQSSELLKLVGSAANEICSCLKNGGKVLLCGNGGSSSDASHTQAAIISTETEAFFGSTVRYCSTGV